MLRGVLDRVQNPQTIKKKEVGEAGAIEFKGANGPLDAYTWVDKMEKAFESIELSEDKKIEFKSQNPRTIKKKEVGEAGAIEFKGAKGPLDAYTCVDKMEKAFESTELLEDKKVKMAATFLDDSTCHWWTLASRNNEDAQDMTWEQFKTLFLGQYFRIYFGFQDEFRENVTTFPPSLVNEKWSKHVELIPEGKGDDNSVQFARYSDLVFEFTVIAHIASRSNQGYDWLKHSLLRLTKEAAKLPRPKHKHTSDPNSSINSGIDSSTDLHPNVIRDPVTCRSKGTIPKTVAVSK
ncbi:hypothetical protein ACLB2K_035500 [Fragaria x ananassa]